MNVALKYLPLNLTRKDRKKQSSELRKSIRAYKKGKYYSRKKVDSYPSKKSKHIYNAEKMYKVDKIGATDELANATKCSKRALSQIIRKGEGAYYSSGSRPNQTAHSWGVARLASAVTSGKAAAVDYSILEKGCSKESKALRLARKSRRRNGYGKRSVPKTRLL